MNRWVPRPLDLAAAAVLTAGSQVELWLAPATFGPRPLLALAYAVGTAAAAWHRIAPLTALVTAMCALVVIPGALGVDPADSFGWFVTVLGLLVSAGYHAPRPVVALATALLCFAVSIVLEKGFVLADIAFAWLLASGAWLAGRAVASRTERAELFEQRAALAEQQAQWQAAAAVAEERLRIAREMHDVVSHSLSVMTLHVSGVRRLLRPEQAEERSALEAVERTGRESLAEMHRMLGVLRSSEDGERGPAPGLDRVPELLDAARRAGLQAELTIGGVPRPLPPGVDLAAYRIVQEAVTNVLRHAAARRLDCRIDYGATCVELQVVDDGRGAAAPRQGGHGLVGMRERAALYGGSVDARPRPAGGFAVHAVLPVPDPEPAPAPAGTTGAEGAP
ncbi:histidine kinase [Blastococcus sp. CT_GayMR19]|uniref:sensor histidine kinase n=1 Tax=Blastococcus sp. CT_GayMR19 TaxID=2559608 RepID=UPI0014307E0B|nr:histidine kinase [Blastococcus sp. CT_GayMR19]